MPFIKTSKLGLCKHTHLYTLTQPVFILTHTQRLSPLGIRYQIYLKRINTTMCISSLSSSSKTTCCFCDRYPRLHTVFVGNCRLFLYVMLSRYVILPPPSEHLSLLGMLFIYRKVSTLHKRWFRCKSMICKYYFYLDGIRVTEFWNHTLNM